MAKKVVIVGTLDTKGDEFSFVNEIIKSQGVETIVVDAGIFEPTFEPDISNKVVCEASGHDLEQLREANDRGTNVKAMMEDYYTVKGIKIEVRIGLDCGPVVAGVIGENKFIYDMWSDTVNTASRMESSSIAGEVHVTARFKEAISEYTEFSFVERGEIDIKGKGKMRTYFINRK